MEPGYVLVKEQLFFRKELIERLPWLIRLRWAVVVLGFAGCGAVYFFRQLAAAAVDGDSRRRSLLQSAVSAYLEKPSAL